MRCSGYNGYGYLLYNFEYLYPILNEMSYDNFEWINIVLNIEDIYKCIITKIKYIKFDEFRKDMNYCYDINTTLQKEWSKVINLFIKLLNEMTQIDAKIAEGTVVEFMEHLLIDIYGDATVVPIVLKLMLL